MIVVFILLIFCLGI